MLIASSLAAAHCHAEVGKYRSRVGVKEPTRLDWTFAVHQRSVVDPPPEWVQHAYDSTKQTYEFYGPPEKKGEGHLLPMVLFVSPKGKAIGWKYWEPVCRQYGIVYAGPHGTNHRSRLSRQIRVVLDVLDDVRRRYPIAPDRTYICGFSEEIYVTDQIGYSLPKYFGGLIAISVVSGPPEDVWLRRRFSERLSVALLTFSRDGTRAGYASDPTKKWYPWISEYGTRAREWVFKGNSHQMPDSATLAQALLWAEEAVDQRRALASVYPSTRIGHAVSREDQAQMVLEDAQEKLRDDASIYSGLQQLEGLRQRWPDVVASTEAQRILQEYDEREHRPWEKKRRADRRRVLEKNSEDCRRVAVFRS